MHYLNSSLTEEISYDYGNQIEVRQINFTVNVSSNNITYI